MDALLSSPLTWAAVVLSTLYLLYKWSISTFTYFSDQGIPGPKPVPFFGNVWGIWRANLPKHDAELVKKYGKVFGLFDGRLPNLWITDTELIRSIFVKDFDHFINRRSIEVKSKYFRKMITLMKDREWKDVRSTVTPTFTGVKIKRMCPIIKESVDRLAEKFAAIAKNEKKLDAKMEFSALAMDVIARCVFCITLNNLGDKDNTFLKKAQAVFNIKFAKSPALILPIVFPQVMSFLAEKIFFAKEFKFFIAILEDLIKGRRNSSEKYNDFIEVASETIGDYPVTVDDKTMPMWNKEEVEEIVIAQSVLFLLGGFDTTSTTLTNICYLLAMNPDVQQKLYEQIIAKMEHYEEVNHEMISDFPYVEQVIREAMRMYPPIARIERECNQAITYNGIHIAKGTIVTVPVPALHYDPEYYPQPDKFDPDRWNHDLNPIMNPYAWMPFGMGPRNCVGVRFAMEEIKIALCTLVKQFRFSRVEETPEKMVFEDGFLIITQPKNTVVGIELRN